MKENNSDKYSDIINLQPPISKKHPRMSAMNRAAQFAPFAALTGYEAAIQETGRLTSGRIELDENKKQILDERLLMIKEKFDNRPVVEITYFVPDERKDGGAYVTIQGIIKKIDSYEHIILMEDGTRIEIELITDIQSDICIYDDKRRYE